MKKIKSIGTKITFSMIFIVLVTGFATISAVQITLSKTLTVALKEKGLSVCRSLAASSLEPILVEDQLELRGLLEKHKEDITDLSYAFITDKQDNIIIHTFSEGFPLHLLWANKINLGQTNSVRLLDTEEGVIHDFAVPIMVDTQMVGTARVGISQKSMKAAISNITVVFIIIILLIIGVGVLMSFGLTRVIVKPIKRLHHGTEIIGNGDLDHRIEIRTGDEIGQLADSFNKMVSDLKRNIGMLEEDEAKYRALFEYSPISLWEEDLSQTKKYMDGLRDKGVKDFRKYFDEHPEEISPCINMAKILDVNESTLKLYEADRKENFLGSLRQIRTEKSHRILIEVVIDLAEGKPAEVECAYRTLTGREITVLVKATIPPGYEKTWSKAFISVLDLTERHRMRQSLELAMEVQQSLLPKADPKIKGVDIAGKSIYCDETGGDYYDYLNLDQDKEDKIGVVVGDVSDHGLPSALLMATARSSLRQRSSLPGSIATIVSDLNRQLVKDLEASGRFMTLFYLTIDPKNRILQWVRAGHDPAIFYDPTTDTFEELRGSGIALGVDENWEYQANEKSDLVKDQIILLGTDGIWEARNSKGEMFGKEPIYTIISRNANLSAKSILNTIIEALTRFQKNSPAEDDVTMVVIKIRGEEIKGPKTQD